MQRIAGILSLALIAMVACGGEPPLDAPPEHCGVPEGAPVRQETYRPLGLFLADNPNLAQAGHLQRAANAVMRDDFLEPARGFAQDVDPQTVVDAMYPWRIGDELHLIFRGANNTLYRRKVQTGATLSRVGSTVTVTLTAHGILDMAKVTVVGSSNDALFPPRTFTVTHEDVDNISYTQAGAAGSATAGILATPVAYSGVYLPPTGHPMRFWEAGGSLFFTTSEGPFRLDSPTSTPVLAGAPQGIEGKVAVTNTTGGWLNYGETVGYRYTWAKSTATDPERLLEGAPSGRMLLTNLVQDATPLAFTWTRAAAVITATDVAHGLSTSDSIVVTTSSDTTAIPLGVYVITVTGVDTFTFTGVDAGGASGTGEYVGDDDGVRNVLATPYIPDGVVLGEDYVKVHRTVITTTGGVDPGEDYALVAERYPTAADITARTTTVEDIAPFANGEDSYFSASAGGVANAFDRPPLITDAIAFQDYILGVAPLQRRTLQLALLAIGGDDGLQSEDGIELTLPNNNTETFRGSSNPALEDTGGGVNWFFYITTSDTVSANLEATVRSIVRVINHRSNYWYAAYASGDTDPPGRLLLVERALHEGDVSLVRALSNQTAWSPLMRHRTFGDFTRVASTVTVNTAAYSTGGHHLKVGDTINVLVGNVNFPAGVKTIATTPTPDSFAYTEAGVAAGPTQLRFDNNISDIEFESVLLQNSWVYSASQQWEAFPPASQVTLGGPTSELFRFEQFGTVGLFFNNEALWRLTGKDPSDFDVRPFPGGGETVRLFAQNTVAKTPAGVFALAEEGALLATDVQFNPKISDPIKPIIQQFVAGSEALRAATKTYAWALGNETEREYWLFLPDENSSTPGLTTQAYVFSANAAAKGGTGWTGPYTSGARTGVYSRVDQRMYLAPNSAGPLLRERRDMAATDFRNPTYTGGVAFEVEMVPFRGTSKDIDKQWVKAIVSPENTESNPMPPFLGMDFSTSNNAHAVWYPGGPHQHEAFNGTYQTYIPEETCRGKELGVRLSHSTASEWLRVTGITMWFNQAAR